MPETTFRILLFDYFTLLAFPEKNWKIIDLAIHFGIILGAVGIILRYFFGIDFGMLFGKPLFRSLMPK